MEDKTEGRVKVAAGAVTGDEAKKAEGKAQQSEAEAAEETKQREKTRQAEAKAAEKERDGQGAKIRDRWAA